MTRLCQELFKRRNGHIRHCARLGVDGGGSQAPHTLAPLKQCRVHDPLHLRTLVVDKAERRDAALARAKELLALSTESQLLATDGHCEALDVGGGTLRHRDQQSPLLILLVMHEKVVSGVALEAASCIGAAPM